MICELTGMDVSNASLYDGATAIWEAILMSLRATKKNKVILLDPINPLFKKVIQTHAQAVGLDVLILKDKQGLVDQDQFDELIDNDIAAVVMQYPNYLGNIERLKELGESCSQHKALFICCANPLSLALLETPASMGADIVVGEGQNLGNPLAFGGPYLGFIACRQRLLRQMPGRICGETKDSQGRRGFVLTIQTREQHIRRDKATSNMLKPSTFSFTDSYLSHIHGSSRFKESSSSLYKTSGLP